jgi:hypothetical protein
VNKPTFAERKELVRYVSELNRLSGNRTATATFLPDPPSENPNKDYLSVNSLEVESLVEIGNYHRAKWQNNGGLVALCTHKVFDYTNAGKKCNVGFSFDRESSTLFFQASATVLAEAYKHRPVLGSDRLNSPSHCGVEFTRALKSQHAVSQFARRMGGKRFHLV